MKLRYIHLRVRADTRNLQQMYVLNEDGDDEPSTLKSGRYIKQMLLVGAEGKILSDIASSSLYLRHLPQTYRSGRTIDAARFVMITAAFEWEYRRNFPDGAPKTESQPVFRR